jgi:hypothetical protein
VIKLLMFLLLLLVGGVARPPVHVPQYHGPQPLVFPHPQHLKTRSPARILVAGLQRGASHVSVLAANGHWPARPAAHGAFVARTATPRLGGPWELRIRFRLHGHVFTVLGAVFEVDQR